MLDPSNFTLTPNGGGGGGSSSGGGKTQSPGRGPSPSPGGERYIVQDPRWRFHGEEHFPKPRPFVGGPRRYRAGRGSSVPLDLSAL
ncbi:hypothetical protein VTH06DRAFT_4261 [Thermothelomyces fergusii]